MVELFPGVVGGGAEEGKRRDMVALLSAVWKKALGEPLYVQERLGFNKEDIGAGLRGPAQGSLAGPLGCPWPGCLRTATASGSPPTGP